MSHKFLAAVLLAAFLGVVAGAFVPADAHLLGIPVIGIYNLFGQLFLRALMLMVVPLVASSIITGAMRLGEEGSLGKLGGKILLTFFCTMAAAVAIGVLAVVLMQPGIGVPSFELVSAELGALNASPFHDASSWSRIEAIIFRVVPDNVLRAASNGEILGLIFFCTLFGLFSAQIGGAPYAALKGFWEATFKVLIKMTQWVMNLLPLGVFGLIAKAVATTGSGALLSLGSFSVTIFCALFFYALIVWPAVLVTVAKVNPWKHIKAMGPALLTAFTTSSSAASLPVALECIEKGSGVSNRVSSLVLSLGVAINLSASALYAGAVVIFIAQLTGVYLGAANIALLYFVTLLTSFGMAGVPSASLIVIVLVLQAMNIPSDHLAMIMAIERFVDMARTAINVFGNSCCAVLVARLEGEQTAIALGGRHG